MKKRINRILHIISILLFLTSLLYSNEIQRKRLAQPIFFPPSHIIFSIESRNGLFLYDETDRTITTISDKRGSGRYFFVSEENNLIAYKEISNKGGESFQRVCFYNPFKKKNAYQSVWYRLCGNPSISFNGRKAFSRGETVTILDKSKEIELDIGYYSNLSPISHNGNSFIFNDRNDQLWLYNINSAIKKKITDDKLGYKEPSWSEDDKKILFSSLGGEIFVYYVDEDSLIHIGKGCCHRWKDKNHISYVKQEVEHYSLISSDIVIYDIKNSKETFFGTPNELEIEPSFFHDRLFYVSLIDGAIYEARIEDDRIVDKKKILDREIIKNKSEGNNVREERAEIILNIPFLHQLYDTKDEFHGGWACGPTSCVMAVQTYNKLTNWGTICTWPYEHMSLFGRYISDIYTYNGVTYDWMSYDPNSNPAYGAYGYICPGGAAVWANMEQYIIWHGLNSFMDISPDWSEFLSEINNGYSVVVSTQLTAAGHIILGKGYVEAQHTLISNDPYGNKNYGYPNYYGSGAFYDWPGYNNGYENLNQVKVFIGARYDFLQTVKIYDDLDMVFSYIGSWLERTGGYDMHAYYTDASVQGDSAFWKIHITQPDTISIYTEFYRGGDRVKNAHYFTKHKDGTAEVIVDQRGYGLSGWYELGTYYFEDSVIIGATDTGSDSAGIVLADAVMLVFHNAAGIKKADEREEKRGERTQLRIFPNPFTKTTTIYLILPSTGHPDGIVDTFHRTSSAESIKDKTNDQCQMPNDSKVISLHIYDVSGRLVKSLSLSTGHSSLGTDLHSGIYFLIIKDHKSGKTFKKKLLKIE